MTYEEALYLYTHNGATIEQERESESLIKEALEKRIPKVAEHEDGVWSICPCCGGSVCNDTEHAVNREVSYCEHCGQAIDWENSIFD